MKKRLLILTLVLVVLMLTSCFLPEDVDLGYNVNVNFYVDGELYKTEIVAANGQLREPNAPHKENYIFDGWYTDGLFSQKYDFYDRFYTTTNLYAKYTLDTVRVVNMLTSETMRSVVTIVNKCYNTGAFGIEKESFIAQGSGVVIDISGGYCYVLTNCHVAELSEGYSNQKIVIEDCEGNQYEAKLYKSKNISEYAISSEYDLAVLYFMYANDGTLNEIEVKEDPVVGDYVISLGTPKGQKNSITIGNAIAYNKLSSNSEDKISNVKFDILIHNAPIDHGSSGGPLVNPLGELVGLNFAGYNDGVYGCAIPMSKIYEFLYKYVYVK